MEERAHETLPDGMAHPEVRPGPALEAVYAYLLDRGRKRRARPAAERPAPERLGERADAEAVGR